MLPSLSGSFFLFLGLTIDAPGPLAVGSHHDVVVERCREHAVLGRTNDLIYPCIKYDALRDVTLTSAGSTLSATRVSDDRPPGADPRTSNAHPRFRLEALAEGRTQLTATATSSDGESLTQTIEVEARLPAHHQMTCVYGGSAGAAMRRRALRASVLAAGHVHAHRPGTAAIVHHHAHRELNRRSVRRPLR